MPGKVCPKCGAALDDDALFCHSCGHKLQAQGLCRSCGAPLEPDARFCPKCGTPIEEGARPDTAPAAKAAPGPGERRRNLAVGLGVAVAIVAAVAWTYLGHMPRPVDPSIPTRPPMTAPTPEKGAMPNPPGSIPKAGTAEAQPQGGQATAERRPAMPPTMPPTMPRSNPHAGGTGTGSSPGHGASPVPGGGGPITGKIELLPSLKDKVKPGAVVFLMARPASSPKAAPIAVAKIPAANFPIPFVLGEQNLMGGQWGEPVNLSARLDQDGAAMSKTPGDLFGECAANPVKPGQSGVKVVLDRVL